MLKFKRKFRRLKVNLTLDFSFVVKAPIETSRINFHPIPHQCLWIGLSFRFGGTIFGFSVFLIFNSSWSFPQVLLCIFYYHPRTNEGRHKPSKFKVDEFSSQATQTKVFILATNQATTFKVLIITQPTKALIVCHLF